MFNIILIGQYNEDTVSVYKKNEEIKLVSIIDILSTKYNKMKNTIIIHDINMKQLDIPGLDYVIDNSDYSINNDYLKTIYLPSFNIFNGLNIKELVGVSDFTLEEENTYNHLISSLEDIFTNLNKDILLFLIRQKKFIGYMKFPEYNKFKNIDIIKKQMDIKKMYSKRNVNNEYSFIVNYELLNEYMLEEGFLNHNEIVISQRYNNIKINTKDKLSIENKKMFILTNFYEGFFTVNNFEIDNEYMNYVDFPSIYRRNNEKIYVPFSLFRFLYKYVSDLEIENIYITERKKSYIDYIKYKFSNKTTRILSSMINFKINFDNFDVFNQNQLLGYMSLFLFDSLSEQKSEENIKISLFYVKYGKGKFDISDKELLDNYNESVKKLSLISLS